MFEIDSSNIYHRTIMFNFSTLLSTILVVNTAVVIHLNRKLLSRKQYLTFSFFILPAIIGAALQFYNPNFLFLWIGISISCLIFFMYLYSSYDDIDFITGLSNENVFITKVNELLNDKTIFTLVLYELEGITYKDTKILKEFANSIVSINPVGTLLSRNSYNTFSVITNSIDINFLKKALNSNILLAALVITSANLPKSLSLPPRSLKLSLNLLLTTKLSPFSLSTALLSKAR